MQLKKYLLKKLPAFVVVLFALGLTSCGSYQYVGQESDGVYGEEDIVQADVQDNADNTYYKSYFKEKSIQMESDISNDVFVDVDSYQGNYSDEVVQVDNNNNNSGYGAWGENSSNVTVNLYSGFSYSFFDWNNPFIGNGWYGNRGWAYGYGGFYSNLWGPSHGGFYNPFGYSSYGYGYGYGGYPYYSGYYGRNGYGRNGVVYSSRRRGSTYGRSSALGRRVEASRRSNTTSTRTRTSSTPRVRTSTPRTRSSNSTPRVRTTTPRTRTSTPRVRTTTPRTRTSTPKTSSPSRSSTRSSSGSSSRSSSGSRRRG
ncbi:hypothetical protein [uncultured Lacinutrix sp.]|uniref:hypothetical protein n=1 Tax=uncultured Lacinutrix sp. TaxID=574032 RepID=UPI002627A366|nr:hypothetical protein [uncultured Lacinutrix sp.]